MKASAPYLSAGGFQVLDVMNDRPECRNAGHASRVVDTAMRARTANTVSPHNSAMAANDRSAIGRRRDRSDGGVGAGGGSRSITSVKQVRPAAGRFRFRRRAWDWAAMGGPYGKGSMGKGPH